MSDQLPIVVFISPRSIKALAICREFFKANDALPSARTLGARMHRSRSVGDRSLAELHQAGILERNEQGGLKFTRRKYTIIRAADGRQVRKSKRTQA